MGGKKTRDFGFESIDVEDVPLELARMYAEDPGLLENMLSTSMRSRNDGRPLDAQAVHEVRLFVADVADGTEKVPQGLSLRSAIEAVYESCAEHEVDLTEWTSAEEGYRNEREI